MSVSALQTVKNRTGLGGRLFVYAHRSVKEDEARHLADVAQGIVLLDRRGAALGHRLKRGGYTGPLLIDPCRYERDPARPVAVPFLGIEQEAVELQSELAVAAYLSPSPYVDKGDDAGLAQVLADGAEFCFLARAAGHKAPAFIVLPIESSWLSAGQFGRLQSALQATTDPLALVLGSRKDPLGTTTAVRNLVTLLRKRPQTAILRTDASALGALAWGRAFVAVGASGTVRHFEGWGKRAFAEVTDHSPRLVPGAILFFVRGSRLESAHGDAGLLDCYCRTCGGASLRRLTTEMDELTANAHTYAVLTDIATRLAGLKAADRRIAWRDECQRAIRDAATLEHRTGVEFRPPMGLRAWAKIP
jgi:hypothetical protein